MTKYTYYLKLFNIQSGIDDELMNILSSFKLGNGSDGLKTTLSGVSDYQKTMDPSILECQKSQYVYS